MLFFIKSTKCSRFYYLNTADFPNQPLFFTDKYKKPSIRVVEYD
jgi:hypothetical protein